MARRAFFTVRGGRRLHSGNRRTGKRFLVILLAVMLVLACTRLLYLQKVLPAMAQRAQNDKQNIYLRIMSFVIPGIGEISSQPTANVSASRQQHSHHKLSLPGLHNPKFFMLAQIPYLGDPEIAPQPLLTTPPVKVEQTGEPKIIIPTKDEKRAEGEIIIYHTHTTEAFEPTAQAWFTEDLSLTVAQLGKELAEMLQEKYGLPVVHNQAIHDLDRSRAYEKARPTLEALLQKYPQAKLVIDLHRDGINRSITTGTLGGEPAARVLFVVGTRYNGYEENLQKAQLLHAILEEIAPGISRGIRQRPLVYNQDCHQGSLLIEIGGHENSLAEARRTLPVLAEAINRLYREYFADA